MSHGTLKREKKKTAQSTITSSEQSRTVPVKAKMGCEGDAKMGPLDTPIHRTPGNPPATVGRPGWRSVVPPPPPSRGRLSVKLMELGYLLRLGT